MGHGRSREAHPPRRRNRHEGSQARVDPRARRENFPRIASSSPPSCRSWSPRFAAPLPRRIDVVNAAPCPDLASALIIPSLPSSARTASPPPWPPTTRGNCPAIIVACGTATAFTVLDAKGRLCGGAIAPGLQAQLAALLGATAQLPTTTLRHPRSALARSTQDAIRAGVMLNFQGGVKEIIQQLSDALPGRSKPAHYPHRRQRASPHRLRSSLPHSCALYSSSRVCAL